MISTTTGAPTRSEDTRTPRGTLGRLVKSIAAVGALGVAGVGALVLWSLLSPPDPDASVRLVNGRRMGETLGYVARVDRESQTVDVSASLLGLHPVMVAVNGETLIMVHDRQGGFGDLWKDLPVRVAYEVLGDTRVARAIEILTGHASDIPRSSNGPAVPPAVAAPSLRPVLENPPTPARGPASPPPPTAGRRPLAEPPARPAQPTAAKGPLTRSETSGAGIQERPADESADADVKDGTAAIDWLIKGSRRP